MGPDRLLPLPAVQKAFRYAQAENGAVPAFVMNKLLRLVQNRHVERVGGVFAVDSVAGVHTGGNQGKAKPAVPSVELVNDRWHGLPEKAARLAQVGHGA